MSVRIKKKRFIPFLIISVVLLIGLITLFIHGCSDDAGGLEELGYTEEQADELVDLGKAEDVSSYNYYTPGLAKLLDEGKLTTKYMKYFRDIEGLITDKDIVTAARLADKGYSKKDIIKLFGQLEDYEITPLLVFDYQSDIDPYIEDCKENSDNSQEHFELDGDYSTYFDGAEKSDIDSGKLMLANKHYYLGEDYLPDDRVTIEDDLLNSGAYNTTLIKEAADSLKKWAEDSEKAGKPFVMQSGFRTYRTQVNVYNSLKNQMGEKEADRVSARPGFSEHQTGYVVDIVARDEGPHSLDDYKNTDAFSYTYKTCAKNGWIMRYPDGKEEITGYDYESWHYRYLGKKTAVRVWNSKMTYDEYHELFLKKWDNEKYAPDDVIMDAAQKAYD